MRNPVNSQLFRSWRWRAIILAAIVPLLAAAGPAAPAQQVGSTDTLRPAGIHAGDCDSPGGLVFELRDLVVGPDSRGTLEFVGAGGASVVEGSDGMELRTTLADLTSAPHLIAVFEGEGSDTIIACGEIGGFIVANDDDLAIGLRPQNDSGFAGVALIDGDDDDNEVEVDIYLARAVIDTAATPGA